MKQVLIVDDAATNLRILEILLKKCECEVNAFVTCEGCLDWVRHDRRELDLVILDYQMPGMNGDYLAAELRKLGYTCHIVILTGYSGLAKELLLPAAGIDAIMNKPITITDVRYMLDRWSAKETVIDARKESRVDLANADKQEIFLYKDGYYISLNATCINKSEHGLAFKLSPVDSGLISPASEITLKSGYGYSVRWVRQREDGQYFGCCAIKT